MQKTVVIMEEEALKQLTAKAEDIRQDVKKLLSKLTNYSSNNWIDTQDAMRMLGISLRTMQTYRDNGLIGFSKVGRKIYYKVSDIEKLLEKHFIEGIK
ncbi:MAG: helix-turn-helix domain-containing protein [Breznakibacter sp.]